MVGKEKERSKGRREEGREGGKREKEEGREGREKIKKGKGRRR
jgi:hypothetical protein